MTRAEIYQRITGILVKTFELDPADIRPESRLYEDLDLDSIDAVDMFVELHEVTGRRIDPKVARNIRTVQDIVALVETELSGAGVPVDS
jgi:acyl carrier protein